MHDMPTAAKRWYALRTRILVAVIAGVIVILGGAGYLLFVRSQPSPSQAQQKEITELVAAVGKLMVLPTDEQPAIATVADPEKLRDQPFFTNATKGSKVLIYKKAHRAILYDPVQKRIIDVAPFNMGPSPTPAQ